MNKAIKSLPTLYRKDKFINKLYDAGYACYNNEDNANTNNYNNIFFSKLNEYGCLNYEYDLGLDPVPDIYDRRNRIESKWKAYEKCSVQSLQSIANRYFDTSVKVSYTGDAEVIYQAAVGFKYKYGEDSYNAWYKDNAYVFPAHMIMTWVYDKNHWGDYYYQVNPDAPFIGKTWEYMNTRTWDQTLNKEIDYDARY